MNINSLLEYIGLIYKRKDIITGLLQEEIQFFIYNLNDGDQYAEIKKHEREIGNMMHQCFGNSNFSIRQLNNALLVIGKLKDKIVSALIIELRDTAWLWSICRDKNFSNLGFGKKMIEFTLDYIHKIYPQYKKVYLYASQEFKSRTNFYKSLGFIETGKIDDGDPEMVYNFLF